MSGNVQEVVLTPLNGGPGHNWKVGHNGHDGSDPSTYPIVSLPPKSGPWIIHFTIQGPNNVKFAAAPVAVQAGSKPSGSGLDPQIAAVLSSTNGKELYVLDRNDGNSAQLYYKMTFVGNTELDPIIDNGGGNRMVFSTLEYVVAAAVVAAMFSLGLFIQKRYRWI